MVYSAHVTMYAERGGDDKGEDGEHSSLPGGQVLVMVGMGGAVVVTWAGVWSVRILMVNRGDRDVGGTPLSCVGMRWVKTLIV